MKITPLPCSLWWDVGSMLWSQPLNVMLSCHCNEGWREVPDLSTCLMPDDQPLTAAILALLVEIPDLGSELHPSNMFVTFALLHCKRGRHQMEHFPRNWPFVRGVHRSPVDSPHIGLWCGTLTFSLTCASTKLIPLACIIFVINDRGDGMRPTTPSHCLNQWWFELLACIPILFFKS